MQTICIVAAVLLLAAVHALPPPTGESKWIADLSIVSFDNTTLHADAFIPVPSSPLDVFPVVIFPNSWGCPQLEYVLRALQLGDRGYVGLEYETRGWWLSGGEIDMAGPLDIQDAQHVIDFVESHAAEWQADMSRVVFAGISYGAGISLLMAGSDPRVKVAVAMSGWNNLTDFAYGEECPNYMQTHALVDSAQKLGHPSAELFELQQDLSTHENLTFIHNFGNKRSPQRLLSQINARNVPVFLSSNYGDRFFRPQYMLEFFPLLTTPKMLLLNNGPHALPEAAGLFLNESYIWNQALLWLERHVKNISNGIDAQKPIQMQLGTSIFATDRLNFTADPSRDTAVQWYLSGESSESSLGFGSLSRSAPSTSGAAATIAYSSTQVLNSGTKDDAWESLGLPFYTNLTSANISTTALFQTSALSTPLTICGTPSVSLQLTSSSTTGLQVYGFLYDVAASGAVEGEYMTEAFFTRWTSPGTGVVVNATFPFHTVCRTVPSGHSIVLGLVLYNEQYLPANTEASVAIASGSTLSIPVSA